jgi:hypothetical protein
VIGNQQRRRRKRKNVQLELGSAIK